MAATIITNDLTEHGLRRLEIMQMGQQVEEAPWLDALPPLADQTLKIHRTHEKDLDVHHLWLTWNPREVILNPVENLERGVYWWIENGGRVSEALADAAAWHYVMLDYWPTAAWIAQMPSGMEPGTAVHLDMGTRHGEIQLLLYEAKLPKRIVVVGAGGDQ